MMTYNYEIQESSYFSENNEPAGTGLKPKGIASSIYYLQRVILDASSDNVCWAMKGDLGYLELKRNIDLAHQLKDTPLNSSDVVKITLQTLPGIITEQMSSPGAILGRPHLVSDLYNAQSIYEFELKDCASWATIQQSASKLCVGTEHISTALSIYGPAAKLLLKDSPVMQLAFLTNVIGGINIDAIALDENPFFSQQVFITLVRDYTQECIENGIPFSVFMEQWGEDGLNPTELIRSIVQSKVPDSGLSKTELDKLEDYAVQLYVDLHPQNLQTTLQAAAEMMDPRSSRRKACIHKWLRETSTSLFGDYDAWLSEELSGVTLNRKNATPGFKSEYIQILYTHLLTELNGLRVKGNWNYSSRQISESFRTDTSTVFMQLESVVTSLSVLNSSTPSEVAAVLGEVIIMAFKHADYDANGPYVLFNTLIQKLAEEFSVLPKPLQVNVHQLCDSIGNLFCVSNGLLEPKNFVKALVSPLKDSPVGRYQDMIEHKEIAGLGLIAPFTYDKDDIFAKADALLRIVSRQSIPISVQNSPAAREGVLLDEESIISCIERIKGKFSGIEFSYISGQVNINEYQAYDGTLSLNASRYLNMVETDVHIDVTVKALELGLDLIVGNSEFNRILNLVLSTISTEEKAYALNLAQHKQYGYKSKDVAIAWLIAEAPFQEHHQQIWNRIIQVLEGRLTSITGKFWTSSNELKVLLTKSIFAFKDKGRRNHVSDHLFEYERYNEKYLVQVVFAESDKPSLQGAVLTVPSSYSQHQVESLIEQLENGHFDFDTDRRESESAASRIVEPKSSPEEVRKSLGAISLKSVNEQGFKSMADFLNHWNYD